MRCQALSTLHHSGLFIKTWLQVESSPIGSCEIALSPGCCFEPPSGYIYQSHGRSDSTIFALRKTSKMSDKQANFCILRFVRYTKNRPNKQKTRLINSHRWISKGAKFVFDVLWVTLSLVSIRPRNFAWQSFNCQYWRLGLRACTGELELRWLRSG